MLQNIMSIFTTATSLGVAIRYLSAMSGALLALLGLLGALTPEQQTELTREVPELFAAIGAVIAAGIPIYAMITKSSSDKAAEAAQMVDLLVPPDAPVEIVTPGAAPNIFVPAKV